MEPKILPIPESNPMKTLIPQPGYVEADALEIIESRQFVYAECFTLILKNDPTLRYTNAQRDITVVPLDGGPGKVTYKANKVLIQGLRLRTNLGVEVDEQSISLDYRQDTQFNSYTHFAEALRLGRFDGATIQRDRFIASAWGQSWVAGVPMFSGLVSSLDSVGRSSARLNVKSGLILLNPQTPRDLWKPNCKHTWGDAGCGLNRGDFVVQTVVGSGSTRTRINWAGVTDDFVMGTAYIEGDDNVTRSRTILSVDPGVSFDVIFPLDFDPTDGQNLSVYPNCRRLEARCGNYHANPEEHFLGYPFVPVVETAL